MWRRQSQRWAQEEARHRRHLHCDNTMWLIGRLGGESIEAVYIFALQLHRDASELGFPIKCIGYDNACKLLAMARMKAEACPPWTQSLAQELQFVSDRFHRDNHTWCLNHMSEVDPLQPKNAKLLANKNTEAAEQLNSGAFCGLLVGSLRRAQRVVGG